MQVYDRYYRDEQRSLEIDIEEFLCLDQASGIYLVKPRSFDKSLCAVNYGTRGPNDPIRAIQDGKFVWDIDVDNKSLTKRKGYVLYDAGKITERVVFLGGVEELLTEFEEKGYSRLRANDNF